MREHKTTELKVQRSCSFSVRMFEAVMELYRSVDTKKAKPNFSGIVEEVFWLGYKVQYGKSNGNGNRKANPDGGGAGEGMSRPRPRLPSG